MAFSGPPNQNAMESLRRSRIRKLALLAAGGGFLLLGARIGASKLLGLMLYHPLRYSQQPFYYKLLEDAKQEFNKLSFKLDQLEYVLPGSNGHEIQKALLLHPSGGPPPEDLWIVNGGNSMVAMDWLQFFLGILTSLPAHISKPAILLVLPRLWR